MSVLQDHVWRSKAGRVFYPGHGRKCATCGQGPETHPEPKHHNRSVFRAESPEHRAALRSASNRAYRLRNPIRRQAIECANTANHRAELRGAPGGITSNDVRALWERQPVCLHCGQGRGLDHIVSMIDGGSNRPDNIQNLCRLCNIRKGAIRSGRFQPRTHCALGHEMQVQRTGNRAGRHYCQVCHTARQRERLARRAA